MIVKTRKTKETDIQLSLDVDGAQDIEISTGHPFFDHMLHQLAWHGGWNMKLKATGDLEIDEHHLVEDVGLLLGETLQEVWRSRKKMQRYGQRLLPMDETLILCAVDLSGRPFSKTKLKLKREAVGNLSCEMVPHFFHSLAMAGAFTLHIRKVTGSNHHHIIEASFKALAQALREALTLSTRDTSTKGML